MSFRGSSLLAQSVLVFLRYSRWFYFIMKPILLARSRQNHKPSLSKICSNANINCDFLVNVLSDRYKPRSGIIVLSRVNPCIFSKFTPPSHVMKSVLLRIKKHNQTITLVIRYIRLQGIAAPPKTN